MFGRLRRRLSQSSSSASAQSTTLNQAGAAPTAAGANAPAPLFANPAPSPFYMPNTSLFFGPDTVPDKDDDDDDLFSFLPLAPLGLADEIGPPSTPPPPLPDEIGPPSTPPPVEEEDLDSLEDEIEEREEEETSFSNDPYPLEPELDVFPMLIDDMEKGSEIPEEDNIADLLTPAPSEDPQVDLSSLLAELKGSQKGGLAGKLGMKDSTVFTTIISSLQGIVSMLGKPMGSSPQEATQNVVQLIRFYGTLLDASATYQARHSRTKAGVHRQNVVKQIESMAKDDLSGLTSAMDAVGALPPATLSSTKWKDVVRDSRQLVIHLSDISFGELGQATGGKSSTVYKLPDAAGGFSFFKPAENFYLQSDPSQDPEAVDVQAQIEFCKACRQVAMENNLSQPAMDYLKTIRFDINKIPTKMEEILKVVPNQQVADEIIQFSKIAKPVAAEAKNKVITNGEIVLDSSRLNLKLDANHSTNLSRRNVATSRIAELLGIGNVVARSRTVKIVDKDNQTIEGNLMEGAKGVQGVKYQEQLLDRAADEYEARTGEHDVLKHKIEDYNVEALSSGAIQKSLSSLQVLDALCGQEDRHVDNVFIQTDDNGRAIGATGIDNDFSFGRTALDLASPARENKAARNVWSKHRDVIQFGEIILPHIDRKLAENIIALNDATVKFVLADLITDEEIEFFLSRLHNMQSVFRKEMSKKNSTVFLENDSDWNESTYQDFRSRSLAGESKYRSESDKKANMQKLNFDQNTARLVELSIRDMAVPYLSEFGMQGEDYALERGTAEGIIKRRQERAAAAAAAAANSGGNDAGPPAA